MKFILTIIMFFLVSACKVEDDKNSSAPGYNVHADIQPYVTTFTQKMKLAGINKSLGNLQASFGSLTPGEGGRCTIQKTSGKNISYTTPILKISELFWAQMTEADKEELIYHELAHCILGRTAHVSTIENSIPISIMYPYHLGPATYVDNYGFYMAELFSNSSSEILNLEFDDTSY